MIVSGVYQWRSLIDGKLDIGSSYNLKERTYGHLRVLRLNKHHSIYFQRAFNKYSESNFVFEIIEYIPRLKGESKLDFRKRLVSREQHYLDTLLFAQEFIISKGGDKRFRKLGYNIRPTADSPLGIIKTEKSKEKYKKTIKNNPQILLEKEIKRQLTLSNNPEIRINASIKLKETWKNNPNLLIEAEAKRQLTLLNNPEIKEKSIIRRKETLFNNPEIRLRIIQKGKEAFKKRPLIICPYCAYQSRNKGNMIKTHLDRCVHKSGFDHKAEEIRKEEFRLTCSRAHYIPVVQLSLEGNFVAEFESAKTVIKSLGINGISNVCKKKQKTAGGFKWMYKSEYDKEFL